MEPFVFRFEKEAIGFEVDPFYVSETRRLMAADVGLV